MSADKTNALARGLSVLATLKGASLTGRSHKDICTATGLSTATVSRLLQTLVDESWAMQLDNGRYALSVRALQIAQSHANEMSRAQDKINELQQRVHAGAN